MQRILADWGWVQNEVSDSPFYHLKWTYLPTPDERVGEGQLLNHFKNSHQLTSKSYLTKNLKNSSSAYGPLDYYPKCFDIGNAVEFEDFVAEYEKNVMRILLEKVYAHMHTHAKALVEDRLASCRLSRKRQGPSVLRSNSPPMQAESSRRSSSKTIGSPTASSWCMPTSSSSPSSTGVPSERLKRNCLMRSTTSCSSSRKNSSSTSSKSRTTP